MESDGFSDGSVLLDLGGDDCTSMSISSARFYDDQVIPMKAPTESPTSYIT